MKKILMVACLALALFASGCREPRFLAAGYFGHTFRSMDGSAWQKGRYGNVFFHDIDYGSGLYMAATNDHRIVSTTNGITWTLEVSDTEHAFEGIAYGGGKFVALSPNGPTWYFDNETYWHPLSFTIPATLSPLKISYAAGHFFISADTGLYYASSGTLDDWQYVQVIPDSGSFLTAVAGDDATLIVSDLQGNVYSAAADTFTSSSNWTKTDLGLPRNFTSAVVHGKYQGTDTFIVSSKGVLKKSTDEGTTWRDVTPENYGNTQMTTGVFQGGQFIMCGENWGMYRSADGGETWEQVLATDAYHSITAIAASTK